MGQVLAHPGGPFHIQFQCFCVIACLVVFFKNGINPDSLIIDMTSTDLISMEVEIKTEHVLLNASRYPIPIAVSLNPVWIEPILAANRINTYLVAFIHYYKITFLLWGRPYNMVDAAIVVTDRIFFLKNH